MNNQSLLRKEQLNHKLEALVSPKRDMPFFLKGAFSILQEEMPIRVAWFFLVDPGTSTQLEESLQVWSGPSPQLETERFYLSDRLFPGIEQLEKMKDRAIRGEAWWSSSELTDHFLYRKILKPEGLFHAYISLLVNRDKQPVAYLVLWKKKCDGKFTDKECGILSGLLPKVGALFQGRSTGVNKDSKGGSPSPSSEARLFSPVKKISGIGEEELYSLIRRRAQPGILMLSQQGKVLYLNHDANLFLEGLKSNKAENERGELPEIIYQLYSNFSKMVVIHESEKNGTMPTFNRICIHEEKVFLLRALLLHQPGGLQNSAHFMILIERVSQGIRVDQIDLTEKLTPREDEVTRLLLEGKTNKEIAVCIDIGEYTVKDHIKRIMKKLDVTTRAGIVAKVLQHYFP